MNNEINYVSPFKKFCITIGNLPTAYLESMSYYEGLTYLVNYLSNNVIPALNHNGEVVEELQEQFTILKNYVDNYFDNLDVQDEINNKLDEMAESGTLTDIIAQYLQLAGMLTYNTVADLLIADNVSNGSFCQTLGYHNINDGGGAIYKISTALPTSYYETLNNGLYAELITNNNTNIKHFGAYGDGTNSDVNAINAMQNSLGYINIPKGNYVIDETINLTGNLKCDGSINYTGNLYGFSINNYSNKTIYIDYFVSDNGGMFNINPSSGNSFSFNEIEVKYCSCYKECLKADATNGTITLSLLKGRRWHSSSTEVLNYNINNGGAAGTYLNELNCEGIDLWGGSSDNRKKAIIATNADSTKEIQFKLFRCDLENSSGITTTGKIPTIDIYFCRTAEIVSKTGWITINDYAPKITIIGDGDLYPNRFTLNNITSTTYIVNTNLRVYDQTSTKYFEGGAVIYPTYIVPQIKKITAYVINSDNVTDHTFEYTQSLTNSAYNYFDIQYTEHLTLRVPQNQTMNEFYIRLRNTISLTISNGTNYTTLNAIGYYKVIELGNKLFTVQLTE